MSGVELDPPLWVRVILVGGLVYVVYGLLLYGLQGVFIYPGRFLDVGPEVPPGSVVPATTTERWWLEEGDARVEALLIRPGERSDPPVLAVIAAHGNAETIERMVPAVEGFLDRGLAVLLVEYPGYGRSTGSPAQDRITALYTRGYDRLVAATDIDGNAVLGYGRSLGGGVVAQLAARRDLRGLILQSTPAALDGFAWQFGLPPFLLTDSYDSEAVLRSFEGPVLLVHGREDREVPFDHARRLARAGSDVRLVGYACGHEDCPPDPAVFWSDVEAFLGRAGIPAAGLSTRNPYDSSRTTDEP